MITLPVPLRKQGPRAPSDSLSYPGPLLSQGHERKRGTLA
ncbi:hypothetical protein ABIC65_003894 [Sphingomonas trueperi]